MRNWLAALLLLAAAVPASAKEGVSLLTPLEAEALRAALPKTPSVPVGLAGATDEELWSYVPPASLRRAVFLGPTDIGCPVHGKEVFRVGGGFYPWLRSSDKPWQVKCPVGGETYPSNDFGAYYRSGMKDRSLLTGPYADGGGGWVDAKGNRFFFVGYWVFHQRWYDALRGITGFTDAYFATGDEQYAHKAAVLFCALAEQYPKMDYGKQGTQGPDGGMILPWCWENQTVVTPMATAYDRLFPYLKKDGDAALREFLKTRTDLGPRKQIEQRFMQTVAKTELTTDMYWSNECDHQLAFADWALAWDNNDPADGITTQQAIDWIISDGGDNSLEELLYNCTYRDGFPCEGSLSYSVAIAERQLEIAERLKRCGHDLFRAFPRLKQAAGCWIDMALADGHTPSIGDGGSVLGGSRLWSAPVFHLAWENYRDPKFAQALWLMKAMRRAPHTPDRTAEIEQAVKRYGPQPNYRTRNLGGMGLAILESGDAQHPRGVALYYGSPAGGHAHHDRLNIEFFDHWQSMMPDLGYPDQWGAKAQQFTQNSIGHYSVLVDEKGEEDYKAGYLDFIKGFEGVQVVSARAERGFPGTRLYRRETALVDVSAENGYLFDVFRVRGGKQHDWCFHLPPVPEWGIEGVRLSAPGKGTLAGDDVPEGGDHPAGNGFNWLAHPQRGRPSGSFTLLSKANPPYPQLRMTMLDGCATEVIVGDHESPRVKAGLPPYMRWLLARNTGAGNLSSAFAAVVEACPDGPRIKQTRHLRTTGGTEPVAAEIRTATYADTLFSDETGEKPVVTVAGTFQGRWGMVRRDAQGVSQALLVQGGRLTAGGVSIRTRPVWRGKIVATDYGANTLTVDAPLPGGEALAGEWMIIANGRHSTCYEIASVRPQGKGSLVQLTEITPMVGKGYVERVEDDRRVIHTDTRWRIFGKDEIWTHDFGPALGGYRLLNEDLSQGVGIGDCKLMPSRARQWWKPDPAWIRVAGTQPLSRLFRDTDGDGKVGWRVYDFGPGFSFRITNSVALRRVGPRAWSMDHRGAQVQLGLPSATALARLIIRDGRGRAQVLPCRYEASTRQARFTVPAGLRGPVAIALKPPTGLNLADMMPPRVTGIKVDGKTVTSAEIAQMLLPDPPRVIEISAQDAANGLDPEGCFVRVGERTVYAGQAGVTLRPDRARPRRGVLRIEPGRLLSFTDRKEGAPYTLMACLSDVGATGKETRLDFRFVLSPRIPSGSVYLSDLEPMKVFAHAGLIRDRAYLGGEMRLGGLLYPKGLMLCPEQTSGPVNYGEAIYSIPAGRFRRLRAVIGICDDTEAGSVVFAVYLRKGGGEWREAFRSNMVLRSSAPQHITIPLGDADEIRLYTDAVGDIGCDHACFASARLEP